MLLRQHLMSENELHQCLRFTSGATLGFQVAKLTNSNYDVFFPVTPMLLMGLVPAMNAHAAHQLLAGSVICELEVGILTGFFRCHPDLMAPLAFLLLLYRFVCMSCGALFLFGAMTTLGILFGQYLVPGNDLIFSGLYRVSSIMVAIVATLLACYLMHHLLNRFEATRFGE